MSRQASAASNDVIDLCSDTDSEDCATSGPWISQSTVTAEDVSFGSFSLNSPAVGSSATGVARQRATRHAPMGNGSCASTGGAYIADWDSPSLLSLLGSMDGEDLEVTPYHPSSPTTLAASNSSIPLKRVAVSIVLSDEEMEPSPPKKRKIVAGKAVARTSGSSAVAGRETSKSRQRAPPKSTRPKEMDKKAINKRMTKKENFIKDFTFRVSPAILGTPFIETVASRLIGYDCNVDPLSSSDDPALIRWERRVPTRYDEQERQWIQVPEYTRFEATNMIYVHAKDLISRTNGIELLEGRIVRLRHNLKLTPKHQLFVMIDDLEAHYRKKGKGSRAANASARQAGYELIAKPKVERALAALQVSQRCFVVHVEGVEDAAEWIYNMTGDIGARPHKLIEQSHLPFSPDISIPIGQDKKDTYQKMLAQINLMTIPRAEAVMTRCPTLQSLFEGYENASDAHRRAEMLMDTIVDFNKDGSRSGRILNIGMSSKIAAVFWSYDSLMSIP